MPLSGSLIKPFPNSLDVIEEDNDVQQAKLNWAHFSRPSEPLPELGVAFGDTRVRPALGWPTICSRSERFYKAAILKF